MNFELFKWRTSKRKDAFQIINSMYYNILYFQKKSMRLCLGTKAFPFTDCTLSIIPTAGFNLIFVTCPISFEYEGIIENESYNIGRAVLRCCKSSVRSNFRVRNHWNKRENYIARKKKSRESMERRGRRDREERERERGEVFI